MPEQPLEQQVLAAARSLDLIDPDGKLIELDSLHLIDLVIELERETGIKIPTAAIVPQRFISLAGITGYLSELRK